MLLDECLPKKLKADFRNCEIMTVSEMGWAGKRNGELLRLAEEKFDVFLTVDQNLRYQQNLKVFKMAIILISVQSNRYQIIKPLIPKIRKTVHSVQPGQLICIADDDDENFAMYERFVREGRQQYAQGKTKDWEKIKKSKKFIQSVRKARPSIKSRRVQNLLKRA